MSNLIPLAPADIEFQLSASIAVAATSFTLSSATDDDGVALAAGLYTFTIDNGKSNKEYLQGDLSGTTVSNVVSVSRQGVSSSGAARAHRVGAPVIISNFASIQRVVAALQGSIDLDGSNVMSYDADPTFNQDQQIITKKYADDLSIAGASDASTTTKGIVEEATEAEINADTAAGGTSARLFVNPSTLRTSEYGVQLPTADEKDALAGTGTPNSSNKYVTDDDTDITRNSGTQTINGTKTFGTIPVLPSSNPTADNEAVRKAYVDAKFARGLGQLTGTTVTNTITETSLSGTKQIDGGILGTDGKIKGRIYISDFDVDLNLDCTVRIKYGGSTVISFVVGDGGSDIDTGENDDHKGVIEFEIWNTGATGTQAAFAWIYFQNQELQSASSGTAWSVFKTGSSSVDSTGDEDIEVTAQWDGADTGNRITIADFNPEVITS